MAQSDRLVPDNVRCPDCDAAGWKQWSSEEAPGEKKWIVCTACLGTGRTDQKGRKRQRPADPS
jgi:hypothetical protein